MTALAANPIVLVIGRAFLQQIPYEEVRRGRVHMIRRKRLPLDTDMSGVTMEYSLSVVAFPKRAHRVPSHCRRTASLVDHLFGAREAQHQRNPGQV